jgi:large subunit ribosomal protein L10
MSEETRRRKEQIINAIQEDFSKCSIGILTDYRGLSAPEMTNLRRILRGTGIEYKVIKNTMARFAAQRAGKDELVSSLEGPVAIAFGYGDITEPAKALAAYIDTATTTLSIKGGLLDDRVLTAEEVKSLSKIPSREILLAKVMGCMQTPISTLMGCLAAPIRQTIGVLQARIQQLEG